MPAKFLKSFFAFLFLIFISSSLSSQVYLDSTASVETRIEDLLGRMTNSQKMQYIGGYNAMYIRQFTSPAIPLIKMSDGPVGVRTWGKSTAYPAGICSAATWDTALIRQLGRSLGRDARARGVHILLAPGVNMHRAPTCGRNFEYYGEDPFLAGMTATSYVKGVQSQRVVATVKHFAANNQEWDRNFISSDMDERTLQEIYLPAFREAVINGKAGAVMSAYNLLNGSYCSHHRHLLTEILKQDWHFDGFVMSDWGAVHDGVKAAQAGLDLEMPFGTFMNSNNLLPALSSGLIQQSDIDDKVRRILRTLFQFRFFDRPQLDTSIPLDDPASAMVALNIARSGIVLLKNDDNILPLRTEEIDRIAVIGPNANRYLAGGGSSWTDPFHYVSVLSAIQTIAGSGVTVTFDPAFADDEYVFQTSRFYRASGSAETGLHAEYFGNQTLYGIPSYMGTDEHINCDWGTGGPPISGFPSDHFSVRWTGVIRPETSGNYEFIIRSDDGCRLYIDNQLIIDQWNDHGATTYRVTRVLEGGTEHGIRIDYYENAGDAVIKMGWFLPDVTFSQAVQNASESDAAILCVGFNSDLEGEGFDRTFRLPTGQDSLINAVARVNPRAIVVLNAGGNVETSGWISNVKGLLHAWFSGQEGGTAVAEILFGVVNPSGKLPVSIEKQWEDNPTFNSYYDPNLDKHVFYSEGLLMGYRYYDTQGVEPLFPFGHGLSYTTFEYTDLDITPATTSDPNAVRVSFDVTNTGSVGGEEVAQLYIHQPESRLMRPYKELKGFSKVYLSPGETRQVDIFMDSSSFSYYKSYLKAWGLDYTRFEILVGASSQDIRLTGSVELVCPDATVPKVQETVPHDSLSLPANRVEFTIKFDKPVWFNNEQQIVIREYSTGEIAEVIPASSVNGAGTSTVTFHNTSTLSLFVKYYITIDSAAFLDQCEHAWEGISDKDAWTFTITSIGYEYRETEGAWLSVYPNPVTDKLIIEYQGASDVPRSLQILDISGRVVAVILLSSGSSDAFEFDSTGLGRGVYYVKMVMEKGVVVRKFVKQ